MQLNENLDMELQPFVGKPCETKPHQFKHFFSDRGITQVQLSKALDMPRTQVSEGLRGIRNFTAKQEAILLSLKLKIDAWEIRENRLWNSPAPVAAPEGIYQK